MLPEQQLKQVAIQPQQVHQTFSAHYLVQQLAQAVQVDSHHYQMMAHEVSLTSQVQQVKVDREHREHREHQVVKVKAEALVYLDYLQDLVQQHQGQVVQGEHRVVNSAHRHQLALQTFSSVAVEQREHLDLVQEHQEHRLTQQH